MYNLDSCLIKMLINYLIGGAEAAPSQQLWISQKRSAPHSDSTPVGISFFHKLPQKLLHRKVGVLDPIHSQLSRAGHATANGLVSEPPHVLLRLQLAEQPELGTLRLRQTAHTVKIAPQLAPLGNVAIGQLKTSLNTLQSCGILAQCVQVGGADVVEL